MGLPHVLVRYYTNPDGNAARRTTVNVLLLLGLFYLLPPIYGVLGRVHLPTMPEGVRSDSIVLRLPGVVVGGLGGDLLTAVLAAGAFAALLSTASGVAMSVAGVLDQSLMRPWVARLSGGDAGMPVGFRLAALAAVAVPYVVSRLVEPIGLATMVGLAFAVAASTFAPLLILGVWWRALSTIGAIAGLLTGAVAATAAIFASIALRPVDGWPGWTGALLSQPAAWSVPLATLVTVVVSLSTPASVPPGTTRLLVRLHTPEGVDVSRSRPDD